ncbi:MAG: DUF2161 family putative PD-(D/E)XK-type phosphodiesterase [Pseudohongiellaceae bacterium]
MQESDLYLPLKAFLETQGYTVKGEVKDCDVVAIRGEESPLIVELKLSLNLDVVAQAVQRLSMTPTVYIGIPPKTPILKRRKKSILKMLRLLGLGLIEIGQKPQPDSSTVKVLLDPSEYQPRESKPRKQRLLKEFLLRVGDPNLGGLSNNKGITTAYRQRAVKVARYLKTHGATKASVIATALEDKNARDIMYKNHYGWFERSGKGIYELSPRGAREIETWSEG